MQYEVFYVSSLGEFISEKKGGVMYALVKNEKSLSLTVQGKTFEMTQDDFDHLASLMMPYITPKDRHFFTMFQNLPLEDREHLALLLKP